MSEFTTVEINIEDESCLIAALEELGYKPKVHSTPVNLYGYQGDVRSQKAHVVISRQQVGSSSNDIGFEKIDGSFVLRISKYDKSSKTFNFSKLKQIYSKHLITKVIRKNPGKFKLNSLSNDSDGNIRMKIKVSRL